MAYYCLKAVTHQVFGHLGRGWNTKNRGKGDCLSNVTKLGTTDRGVRTLLTSGLKATNTNPVKVQYINKVLSAQISLKDYFYIFRSPELQVTYSDRILPVVAH